MILLTFCLCAPKREEIEKVMEDGVEVVINHLEPYKVEGDPTSFVLEEIFTIDTEKADVVNTGLTDINYFDVDSEGSIYFLNEQSKENFILKFDRDGNYVTAFGRKGQGPGELQFPIFPLITGQDEIVVMDQGRKFVIYAKDGSLNKEVLQDISTMIVYPLENGKYLMGKIIIDSESDYDRQYHFSLFSSEFKELATLGRLRFPNIRRGKKLSGITPGFLWSISKINFYVGNEERGYEIKQFDFEGNLIRKIRKDYKKVPIPEEYKKEKLQNMSEMRKELTDFPGTFPPFQCSFVDDRGKLFVMTYESGKNAGEYMCDIFNPEGVFIARASLGGSIDGGIIIFPPKTKKNRFYCIREKESGYKELAIFNINWDI